MAPPPVVSVVVPTCGRHELLLRCLQALGSQTLAAADFEVIVVDDGRADATSQLVQTQADGFIAPLHYLRPPNPQSRGPAAARNAGWRAARGEIVAFTDDDTVPLPDWLATGIEALQKGHWAALAGRVQVPRQSTGRPSDHERMTQGLERSEFVTANAFVWRSAMQRIEGFDERFTRAWREDSDLQFSLLERVGPVGRCEQAVVLHPVRPERWGVSLRQQKNAFFEALLYAKHPKHYRQRIKLPTPWRYYAISLMSLLALAALAAGWPTVAAVAAAGAGLLVLRFALRRLRHSSRAPRHVLEMLLTSALIPFLSVYWRLRGAWHFRVWFL